MKIWCYVFEINFSIGNKDHWIGLTASSSTCKRCPDNQPCDACRATWTWLDCSPMTDIAVDMWHPNDPDGGTGCVRIMKNSGKWADYRCENKLRFICEQGESWSAIYLLCFFLGLLLHFPSVSLLCVPFYFSVNCSEMCCCSEINAGHGGLHLRFLKHANRVKMHFYFPRL